jgi:hypothetical protein
VAVAIHTESELVWIRGQGRNWSGAEPLSVGSSESSACRRRPGWEKKAGVRLAERNTRCFARGIGQQLADGPTRALRPQAHGRGQVQ